MSVFHDLIPGKKIPNDWFDRTVPDNIKVGEGCKIESAHSFIHFFSKKKIGLQIGNNSIFYQTSFSIEPEGYCEIGSDCYFSNAALVVSKQILIGNRVMIAGGVTIADSNFHPIDPALRLEDIMAISPSGDKSKRPKIESMPVVIEDDVWIGYNATILSGVTVGKGSFIQPGAVLTKSVPPNSEVIGNPGQIING